MCLETSTAALINDTSNMVTAIYVRTPVVSMLLPLIFVLLITRVLPFFLFVDFELLTLCGCFWSLLDSSLLLSVAFNFLSLSFPFSLFSFCRRSAFDCSLAVEYAFWLASQLSTSAFLRIESSGCSANWMLHSFESHCGCVHLVCPPSLICFGNVSTTSGTPTAGTLANCSRFNFRIFWISLSRRMADR